MAIFFCRISSLVRLHVMHDIQKRVGPIPVTVVVEELLKFGNADNDVEFDRFIPASYELDNLMVVGAVDQAGERTSFTSMGENVVVYANGFEVESYVPGGQRMAFSGTSMASPNALNLAAKLITAQPDLQPAQIIRLIEQGADELAGQAGLKLLNPAATMALLKSGAVGSQE
jgi:subtilisin family serine protease